MPDWQINMNRHVPFFNPTPRRAMLGDNLYWTNNTNQPHLPWPLDADGSPEPTGWGIVEIPPGESSDPVPVPGDDPDTDSTADIEYYCQLHPQNVHERGKIQVRPDPPNL